MWIGGKLYSQIRTSTYTYRCASRVTIALGTCKGDTVICFCPWSWNSRYAFASRNLYEFQMEAERNGDRANPKSCPCARSCASGNAVTVGGAVAIEEEGKGSPMMIVDERYVRKRRAIPVGGTEAHGRKPERAYSWISVNGEYCTCMGCMIGWRHELLYPSRTCQA
jgi:hypothetical protein